MPKAIRVAAVILWIQVIVAALFEIAALVMIFYKAQQGFWLGFQQRLATSAGSPSVAAYGPSQAGRVTGFAVISLALLSISLWSIKRRRFWPIVVCNLLLILGALGQQSISPLPIAVLVLVCTANGRAWLMRRDAVA